ncbi:hypothetical protein [Actinopolymorpha pittospori]
MGAQLVGHVGAEIAKRVDVYATALSYRTTVAGLSDLDLSYTPPLGSPVRRGPDGGPSMGASCPIPRRSQKVTVEARRGELSGALATDPSCTASSG